MTEKIDKSMIKCFNVIVTYIILSFDTRDTNIVHHRFFWNSFYSIFSFLCSVLKIVVCYFSFGYNENNMLVLFLFVYWIKGYLTKLEWEDGIIFVIWNKNVEVPYTASTIISICCWWIFQYEMATSLNDINECLFVNMFSVMNIGEILLTCD
jgi:hypothetical protein